MKLKLYKGLASRPRLALARPGGGSAQSQRGVALIITLILLAVITFMAVTFLVVSRSQRGAVSTTTDQTIAREAANTAQDRAIAEALASIIGFTNQANYGLTVSTNFISPVGFRNGISSFTNVSYNYPNGQPVSGNDALLNLSQLLLNPRPPVYMTNRTAANSNDFRYYLDWNRNGRYDTNGWQPVMDRNNLFLDTNYNEIKTPIQGNTLSNFFVGDPEWIGALERADLPHSSSNRFLYRYAYVLVPAGSSLDVNYVHNYSRMLNDVMTPAAGDGFVRNQGVGTYEINLAAFLTDLNTNFWPFPKGNALGTPYVYNVSDLVNLSGFNQGSAFDDALSFVRHRYESRYKTTLQSFRQTVGNIPAAMAGVTSDYIDTYSKGPIMTNAWLRYPVDPDQPVLDKPWAGADNTNHYFSPQDYFDPAKTSLQFSNRLWSAGTNNDSYDRYTFYRLLSQMSAGSSWEQPAGKININYDNQVRGITNTGRGLLAGTVSRSATNFIPWRPIDFFTNAANKLLENAGYNLKEININNIQIYPTNFYTPSIHQLLQLAANIYDATTNQVLNASKPLPAPPSVFRPLFRADSKGGTNIVRIIGYEEVVNAAQVISPAVRWFDLTLPPSQVAKGITARDMVYGVPLVVGVKKGLPNFNELSMQTSAQVARKLEFRRAGGQNDSAINETNVMYTLSVSNIFGVEAWNSYSNTYPRSLEMHTKVEMFCTITNEYGQTLLAYTNPPVTRSNIITLGANTWAGVMNPDNAAQATVSFRIPLAPVNTNNFAFLRSAVYREAPTRGFVPISGTNLLVGTPFERHPNSSIFPLPHWFLNLRTRLKFILIDTETGGSPARIIDYVNLDSIERPLDIASILTWGGECGTPNAPYVPDGEDGSMWCTNRWRGSVTNIASPTFGMLNQISVGLDNITPANWTSFQPMYPTDKEGAIDFFRAQFDLPARTYTGRVFSKTNVFYAPFVPTRNICFKTEWQANDPLVHYTIGDLVELNQNFQTNRVQFTADFTTNNLGAINRRYEPWGGVAAFGSSSPTLVDLAVKDPMVTRSDDWEFPTNKFPNIGWLGRVHRGTPWQTIDLKSKMLSFSKQNDWQKWSGNGVLVWNVGQFLTNVVAFNTLTNDAAFTHPINDRYILDLFTASVNDNATRGQLSVNQTNLAAWSAVLAGVNVMPNTFSNSFIEPAGVYSVTNPPPVVRIVNGIQRAMTNYPGHAFRRLGDVLAVPELTVNSPFIQSNARRQRDLSDAVYERLPQQILGLLKGADEPRFVIYAFGQALKPAERSLVTSGPYFGLCTNYLITAEAATRAVVRIEGAPHYPHPFSVPEPLSNLRAVVESFNVLPPD